MPRCVPPERRLALRAALVCIATCWLSAPALAQVQRNFPPSALRGEISFSNPPEILLNGAASRLAPGARIRDQANMMVVSGALTGQKWVVNYTLDHMGQPRDVWLLRTEEIANQPWPRTAEQAQAWTFDPAAQTWTKP